MARKVLRKKGERRMIVYIVVGKIDYEGSANLEAFSQRDKAEEFVSKIQKYEHDYIFSENKDYKKYSENHPAKTTIYDDYWIDELEISLKEMSEEDRLEFIYQLDQWFCIHCGYEKEKKGKTCYCRHDE
jgi:hypothetical protein